MIDLKIDNKYLNEIAPKIDEKIDEIAEWSKKHAHQMNQNQAELDQKIVSMQF